MAVWTCWLYVGCEEARKNTFKSQKKMNFINSPDDGTVISIHFDQTTWLKKFIGWDRWKWLQYKCKNGTGKLKNKSKEKLEKTPDIDVISLSFTCDAWVFNPPISLKVYFCSRYLVLSIITRVSTEIKKFHSQWYFKSDSKDYLFIYGGWLRHYYPTNGWPLVLYYITYICESNMYKEIEPVFCDVTMTS